MEARKHQKQSVSAGDLWSCHHAMKAYEEMENNSLHS